MSFKKSFNRSSKLPLVVSVMICAASGIAALAQADFSNTGLSRLEQELRGQIRLLSRQPEPWATAVKGRAEFALLKLQSASMVSNPAVENMHLDHACDALADERALLIEAQLGDVGSSAVIEALIEQTFSHRDILGCEE